MEFKTLKVALETAPGLLGCLDDARSRRAQLFQLGTQLGLQPLVLQFQARSSRDTVEQFVAGGGWT